MAQSLLLCHVSYLPDTSWNDGRSWHLYTKGVFTQKGSVMTYVYCGVVQTIGDQQVPFVHLFVKW